MAREMRTIGKIFNANIEIFDACKYTASAEIIENPTVIRCEGITSWEIISGEDAEEILRDTDYTCVDDYNEYLVLYFENGSQATFRNSYVEMFRVA